MVFAKRKSISLGKLFQIETVFLFLIDALASSTSEAKSILRLDDLIGMSRDMSESMIRVFTIYIGIGFVPDRAIYEG